MQQSNKLWLYIAAPLFSEGERRYNERLKTILRPLFRVYLPQSDGPLFSDLIRNGGAVEAAQERIYQSDIEALQKSDVLLILLDGLLVDAGAAFELGFARALRKRCFGLRTDFRSGSWVNPMIARGVEKLFSSEEELITELKVLGANTK